MNRLLFLFVLVIPSVTHAQAFKMEPGPKSPQESLKCIKVRPGFQVELMVSEPLVRDPIAFAWGPDGKFWVVEMGDYPLGIPSPGKSAAIPGGKPGGRIKYLEKSKPGGPYDKMTLFLDNLSFPTGVFPYNRGVLVTCAPDIFYAEPGKNGKVHKEILFTGFKEGNQQHRVNGLTWGIDNWIYGANGDSGGIVKSLRTGKSVNISGRDFRFKPETGEFETVTGQSQFGRCRDDWGNWFGCNNSNPLFHFVLEDRYLKRNPHVLYPNPKVQVIPGAIRVYPISKPLPRFNSPQGLNHFTSACSAIIYRDNFFGKEFEGNVFISEPVHNLIHRQILKPKGVTFTAQRAADEQTSEFLASSDNWFRPTMIQVGPDGALWIADMYRYVIEHPEWIPKDWQKKLDLRAGHDKGRIYRVLPVGKKPRDVVRMDGMKVEELVKQLESPNGWVRDTAHQFLIYRGYDKKELPTAAKAIAAITRGSQNAQARLHGFFAYEALFGWSFPDMENLARNPNQATRKHILETAEGFNLRGEARLLDFLEKGADDQMRLQIACSLGTITKKDEANHERLARILRNYSQDPYILAAGLSSVSSQNWSFLFPNLLHDPIPVALFSPLMRIAKATGNAEDAKRLMVRQLSLGGDLPKGERFLLVAEFLEHMTTHRLSLNEFLKIEDQARKKFSSIHADAFKVVSSNKSGLSEKLITLRLLARGLGNDRDDHKLLLTFLTPRTPDDVQAAVIQQLGGHFDPRVPGLLLKPWKSYSPPLRGQALDTLLSRPTWTKTTLDAIESKQVPAQEIDAIRRQRFLQHKDVAIRTAAVRIFRAAENTDRGKLADLYWLQLPSKTDASRGAKLFAKSCAVCHKVGNFGNNVGPDLASVKDRSPQGLLTAILDPNRAVETRFINYQATTKKGLTYTGILSAETSTTITLTAADGKEHQLLRNELEDLSSTGKSLMPEGLEKDLRPQDIADIIAYVRSIHVR